MTSDSLTLKYLRMIAGEIPHVPGAAFNQMTEVLGIHGYIEIADWRTGLPVFKLTEKGRREMEAAKQLHIAPLSEQSAMEFIPPVISRRDWFAGQAMRHGTTISMLMESEDVATRTALAERCYRVADAMIAASGE